MNFFDKVKQLWISLRLEKNPYYYYMVDIQSMINDLHHVMTEHKLNRNDMKDATLYITILRDYKRLILSKLGRSNSSEMEQIINDLQLTMTAISNFITKVHNEDTDTITK